MKIIHTADWHLGRTLHKLSLEPFQAQFLDHIVELTEEESPDALIVAGDIYDRAVASPSAIHLLEDALRRLTPLTKVILIPGNHDSAKRLGFASDLYTDSLRIVVDVTRVGEPIILGEGEDALNIYPIPYLNPETARSQLQPPGDDISAPIERSHEAVMRAALHRVDTDFASRTGQAMAIIHAFVAGSSTSDSERDISVGGSQSVSPYLFSSLGAEVSEESTSIQQSFGALAQSSLSAQAAPLAEVEPKLRGPRSRSKGLSYVAAGHLHRPQTVASAENGAPFIRYSGSPLPFSFSEANDHKSTSIVTIDQNGVDVRTVEVPQPYSLHTLRASFDELIHDVPAWAATGYASLEVTDATRPNHLIERLRAVYPNALLIRHIPQGSDSQMAYAQLKQKRGEDLAREFFALALGRPVDAVESNIIDETWRIVRQAQEES